MASLFTTYSIKYFLYVILLILLSLTGCDLNSSSLKAYSENWFRKSGLSVPDFDCRMKDNSRAGSCIFKWPTKEFGLLEKKLKLSPSELKPSIAGVAHSFESQKNLSPEMLKMLLQYDFESRKNLGCGHREPFSGLTFEDYKPSVFFAFTSENDPGKIFPQNTSSSFTSLWYSPDHGIGCLNLHFPYG